MLLFLVYHRVGERRQPDVHSTSARALAGHVSLIARARVPVLDPRALPDPDARPKRGIVLTFDDGTSDHMKIVQPILSDAGLPGLFFVPSERLGSGDRLTAPEVAQLWEAGHTIGSHSHSHPVLTAQSPGRVAWELEQSAATIASIVGERPRHFAPPGGFHNESIRSAARTAGYKTFRTMEWGYNRRYDPMRIEVLPMTDSDLALRLALEGRGEAALKLLYRAKELTRRRFGPSPYSKLRSVGARVGAGIQFTRRRR